VLLGIVSDVHCNVAALDRALSEMTGTVDEVLLAGDAVLQYRFSNEIMERVRAHGIVYVAGNHELTLLEHGQRALTSPEVVAANVETMAAAPLRHERTVSGKRLLMVHASPFPPYDEYLYPGTPQLARCAALEEDILVLGHTHVPMATRIGRTLVVNPGSLGQGGDPDHPGMLSYAVLDTDSDEVVVHRFPHEPVPSAPAPSAPAPSASAPDTPRRQPPNTPAARRRAISASS
jgi:putative phosphoesterase